MLSNFFKIAFRNILRNKIYSFINIAGFAIGLASCIIIMIYVSYELSYDKFHDKADKIYRVTVNGKLGDNEFNMASTPPPMAQILLDNYPEVINTVRLQPSENMLIRTGNENNENFIENDFIWADSSFFDFFTYKLILGENNNVLAEPHTVVLTKSAALKYFGRLDVIGTILEFEDFTPYKITGVCEDPPDNAHFRFDILASLKSLDYDDADFWLGNPFNTYIMLAENSSATQLKEKLPELVNKYVGPQMQEAIGSTLEDFKNNGGYYRYGLQSLTDIHLNSNLQGEIETNGDILYIYIFSFIALFILAIACINFMNLSTARSMIRAKEVGVRKVLGSHVGQIIKQFLAESIIITTIAMLIAVGIAYLFLPYFNDIAGKEYSFLIFNEWYSIPAIFISILVVGFLAGIYPAVYLSSFQPVKVLKTSLTSVESGSSMRKVLVVFQFSVSIMLIIGTLVINDQLSYVQDKKLGWDKDHILVIKRAWAVENNEEVIKNELLSNPNILTFTSSWAIPGRIYNGYLVWNPETPRGTQHLISGMSVKYDFDKTYSVEVKEGRLFSKEFLSDSLAVVLNETAVSLLGYKDPVGKRLTFPGANEDEDFHLNIIGVVKDFHFESLHHKINPLLITLERQWPGFISMKINPVNVQETVAYANEVWAKYISDKPFEYFFADEDFARLYENEERTGRIFSSFSVLAIIIACLGLFGLATFITNQRKKEIGIRKTLGASIYSIVYLLSKQFSIWVILANLIAWPVAYYFMGQWLNNFEYRIDVNLLSFLIAAVLVFLIALITVAYQSIRAAMANPVDSIKYE
ncbi:MAG: ABC transporter permease [Ignavibacteria bacterium]|jgi:putative ABC transport system permease protein